jgi:two-component system response regulator YesN
VSLSVLLVDDEVHILRNLVQIIPWQELGFERVLTSSNGQKAWDLIEIDEPDLILCDIRMPVMDGIALLEKLRKEQKDVQVIMLTGFQDFEYVRASIQAGARDYILKPFNYDELKTIVEGLAVEIREKQRARQREKKKWSHFVHLAYERLLLDILLDYTTVTEGQSLIDEEVDLNVVKLTVMLVDLDGYSELARDWSEQDRKLRNFAIRNVLQDALSFYQLEYAAMQTREGEWCVLIQHRNIAGFQSDMVMEWALTLQRAVLENVKLAVSVGIFNRNVELNELSDAYKKTQRLLHLSPQKQGIHLMEDTAVQSALNEPLWDFIDEIVVAVKQRDRSKMELTLAALTNRLKSVTEHSYQHVEQILNFMLLHLIREMREIGIMNEEIEKTVWSELDRCVSVKDLLAVLNRLVQDAMNTGLNRKTGDILMLSAKSYIDKHITSDFGIEEIADALGISSSYFSLLFKQHFGETFLEYLTRQRMERAKSLLAMSDKSVTQIGKLVGYAERRYFTKVFTKYTGCTPSEYRDSLQEN